MAYKFNPFTGTFDIDTVGTGAFLTVAAADTPTTLRLRTDYKCDGTDDEEKINDALVVADAVWLCPGMNFFIPFGSLGLLAQTALACHRFLLQSEYRPV